MVEIDLNSFPWPQSIRGINNLERSIKEAIYLTLIPAGVLERFHLSDISRERLQVICPHDTRSVEIRLFPEPEISTEPVDPIFYLHMADTLNYQIAILLLAVNDPEAPRYNTDVTPEGQPTRFGTFRRNVSEEVRAMEAGLSPGQVRKGLRLSREAIPNLERFIVRAGHEMIILDPLTYNNAIVYERYGFAYIQGRRRLEWINEVLRPGGAYFSRFDESTPFRGVNAWKSIRGRSWAIHDSILDEPFGDIRMYKRVQHHAGLNTFPDGVW
jgi:acetoin utilization protein AcuC